MGKKDANSSAGAQRRPPMLRSAALRRAHNTTKAVKGTPGSYKAQKQELSTCKHFCFFVDLPEKWSNCYSHKTHRVSTYLQRASASRSRAGGTDQRARRHPFTCCSQLLLGEGVESQSQPGVLPYLRPLVLMHAAAAVLHGKQKAAKGRAPRRQPEWDFNKKPGGNGPSTTTS